MESEKFRFKVTAGIFPFDILFMVGYDRVECIDALESDRGFDREDLESCFSFDNRSGRGVYIMESDSNVSHIFLPTYTNDPKWMGVASHEISHACINILSVIGQKIDQTTEETFCYLHQYLIERVLTHINEKTGSGTREKVQVHRNRKGSKNNEKVARSA